VTVGLSNLLTGITGTGFTGSYIFSQTVFTLRTGCTHRLNGLTVVGAEAILFLLPFSVIQTLPNFYYGALMLVFGLEIALDWLVFSKAKFAASEYALTLSVFALIMIAASWFEVSGLEIGIAVGVLVCAVHFAVEYSKVQVRALREVASVSACVRPSQQRAVLELFRSHMCAAPSTQHTLPTFE
jgi:sulfate permease, SulP family